MKRFESLLRLSTGLILATYIILHFANHALGIVSFEIAEAYRESIGELFQTVPGQIALYGSFLFHGLIALKTIYLKNSLRMPIWQWMQVILGLSIWPLLAGHVISTRLMDLMADTDPNYYMVVTGFLTNPYSLPKLIILFLVVWGHMTIGLHFWLRIKQGYTAFIPYLYAVALIFPMFAFFGALSMMRRAEPWLDDPDKMDEIFYDLNYVDYSVLDTLSNLESQVLIGLTSLLFFTLLARQVRLWVLRKSTIKINHSAGKTIRGYQGQSLLDMLRSAKIPHASVCGGRARCTTCRVKIRDGLKTLHKPTELEEKALQRIDAPPDIRLACQIQPRENIAIAPLVLAQQPLEHSLHKGGVQGHEEYVVAMFVDMRGSTSMGERVLAYDVVFILNQFFTELSLALEETHGHYAQFAGDGLMALYGIGNKRKQYACRDALQGARVMFQRLEQLNKQLASDFGEHIQMGVGIHGGEAIVGTMGPPKTPLLTAVGDNINIAARLESQTKSVGCDLIVSVESLVAENIDVPEHTIQELSVRGRNEKVTVCTLKANELLALTQSETV